jgi:hypothetical protein
MGIGCRKVAKQVWGIGGNSSWQLQIEEVTIARMDCDEQLENLTINLGSKDKE